MLVTISKLRSKIPLNASNWEFQRHGRTTKILLDTHVDTINYFGRDSQHVSLSIQAHKKAIKCDRKSAAMARDHQTYLNTHLVNN
jgi:hypothetical protein